MHFPCKPLASRCWPAASLVYFVHRNHRGSSSFSLSSARRAFSDSPVTRAHAEPSIFLYKAVDDRKGPRNADTEYGLHMSEGGLIVD